MTQRIPPLAGILDATPSIAAWMRSTPRTRSNKRPPIGTGLANAATISPLPSAVIGKSPAMNQLRQIADNPARPSG